MKMTGETNEHFKVTKSNNQPELNSLSGLTHVHKIVGWFIPPYTAALQGSYGGYDESGRISNCQPLKETKD